MVGRLLLASLCVAALTAPALANGRAPATSTINFRKGMENEIAAGMTFGLVISKDGGATWHWVCEDAIGYGGMYDPDYAFTRTGALFATTFDGLKVNRDGCVYEPSALSPPPPEYRFFSVTALGPDDAVYAAASDPADAKIYKSTDNGMTFPVSAQAGELNDWYQSLEVAPSNANRLYLSGYRFVPNEDMDAGGNIKVFFLYRSDNGGQSWMEMPVDDFATMPNSTIEIAGISKTNADLVYARVTLEDNAITDALYVSTDAGQSWTKILSKQGSLSFVVRANGDIVAATQREGVYVSRDNGANWETIAAGPGGPAPHINCLVENTAGEIWACTQNYGGPQAPSDGFGIMKTTDLMTWTGVLRFQDIVEPLPCPDTTTQYSKCACHENPMAGWFGLCLQLGCDDAAVTCPGVTPPDAPPIGPPSKPGCCSTGDSAATPALVGLWFVVGLLLFRRRR